MLVLALAPAACTNIGTSGSEATTTTASNRPTLSTEPSPAGPILATGAGQTLYDFSLDTPTTSACTNVLCTILWPPLTVKGRPTASGQIQLALIGLIQRPDGSMQVTYAGHPLYTYKEDISAGMITGQAVRQSGGYWYVISPTGQQIQAKFNR